METIQGEIFEETTATPRAALAVAPPPQTVTYALAPPSFAMPRSIADIQVLGRMMVASGFFKDLRSEAQACVKIIAGSALGYDAVTALNAFHIIEGKITPTASEIGARIKRSGKYNYRVKSLDDAGCTMEFLERDGATWMSLGLSTFTKQDAVTANVAGKQVWKSYFRNMAFARALTNGVRWYCPDLFGGPVYTPEELGAPVDIRDGEMIVLADEPKVTPQDPEPAPTKDELRALYAKACALDPSLVPGALGSWVTKNIAGYTPSDDGFRRIKAALDVLIAQGPTTVQPAPRATGPAPTPTPAAAKPTHAADAPIADDTRKHLLAALRRIGIVTKPDRLKYAAERGYVVASFTELTDRDGRALAEDATNAARCPACGRIEPNPHLDGCPEEGA